jgi:HD-GYP domain-containing protein (c-di-GMP phosphodiesterase class II)
MRVTIATDTRITTVSRPDALTGDDIPLLAQIAGIVDVFDAITSTRPDKAARGFEEVQYDVARGRRHGNLVRTLVRIAHDRGWTAVAREIRI